MSVSMHQEIKLTARQQMVMTLQQQQSLRLLQYSTMEFEAELYKMLQENPMLELVSLPNEANQEEDSIQSIDNTDISDDYSNAYRVDSADYLQEINATKSLQDYLLEQLSTSAIDYRQKTIISYLIGDIDDNGYLTTDLSVLTQILSTTLQEQVPLVEVEQALTTLQRFDPIGIAARSLSECLLLQLDRQYLTQKVSDDVLIIARQICQYGLEALARADIATLEQLVHADITHIRQATQLIQQLNPKPGKAYSVGEANYIVPDLLCQFKEGQWAIYLNPQILPKVRVHKEYERLIKITHKKEVISPEIASQLKQARAFLGQMNQRFATILLVAQTIMQEQYDFFTHGMQAIKPLTLKQIAEQLSLHESTISRTVNQKYIDTPHGIFELKRFFSSGLNTQEGSQTSATAIQLKIKAFIEAESKAKPLSDNQLMDKLHQEGIEIARRTVAKYREAVGFPAASIRKAKALL
ncbi:RNA polymerase factor sigma-54 [Pelistega ratti]|uniref:RNA polymerase factor sigma-54 n=1 Tax=Pelistega ratti TaxID=2652177 RepID=UPI00135C9064|nr:RNA polymerase factor sigma-54 [Pelistega ratti]